MILWGRKKKLVEQHIRQLYSTLSDSILAGQAMLLPEPVAELKSSIDILVQNKYDLNTPDKKSGATLLVHASASGELEIVQYLLTHGADPNTWAYQREGQHAHAPIMAAADEGHPKVIEYLLSVGADPNAQDKSGKDALARVHAGRRLKAKYGLSTDSFDDCVVLLRDVNALIPEELVALSRTGAPADRLLEKRFRTGIQLFEHERQDIGTRFSLFGYTGDDNSLLDPGGISASTPLKHCLPLLVLGDSEGKLPPPSESACAVNFFPMRDNKLDLGIQFLADGSEIKYSFFIDVSGGFINRETRWVNLLRNVMQLGVLVSRNPEDGGYFVEIHDPDSKGREALVAASSQLPSWSWMGQGTVRSITS